MVFYVMYEKNNIVFEGILICLPYHDVQNIRNNNSGCYSIEIMTSMTNEAGKF